MKKIILIIVLASMSFISCQKDEIVLENAENKNIHNLSNDAKFKELVNKVTSFNNKLNDRQDNNISNLAGNLSKGENYIPRDLQNDIDAQIELADELNDIYDFSNNTEAETIAIIQEELEQMNLDIPETFKMSPAECYRKYRNDYIIITAAAIGAHIGCSTTDIIAIGFLCHAAVGAGHIAALDNAYLEYKNCK